MRIGRLAVAGGGLLAAAALAVTGTVVAHADEAPTVRTPQIVGGSTVASAPWIAQVDQGDGPCSGTIIAPHWVLSAAHCIEGNTSNPGRVTVRVGAVRPEQGILAKAKSLHTRFDVLLVELDHDISTTYSKLAEVEPPTGAGVNIYGWGFTCETCGLSPVLKTASMTVDKVSNNGDSGERMVDLKQNGGGYALPGDSGGPAIYNGLQFGVLCCGDTAPDGSGIEAYSSLPNSMAWIKATTGIGGAQPGPVNVALNRPATGSAPCASTESAASAVNGSVTGGNSDKWCSAAATKTLTVDLGTAKAVSTVTVRHAQAGGEPAGFNTRDYDVQTSMDGTSWATAAQVRGNTQAVTSSTVTGSARYVRLSVLSGATTGGNIARIYELEVYA